MNTYENGYEKCDTCIHNEVCHAVAECLTYLPDFSCENYIKMHNYNPCEDCQEFDCYGCKYKEGDDNESRTD